jgi:hypothetical protein
MDLLTPIAWRADHVSTPSKTELLDKIRAMLAKAEGERELGNEAYADECTAIAMRWMAKHGIDEKLAKARAHASHKPMDKVFTVQAPYANTKNRLLSVVAKALHCQPLLLHTAGADERVHVFGFESDLELVEMLYTSLLLQMSSAVARHSFPSWISGRGLMAERRSFMFGFIAAVKPRLEAAYALAEAEADDTGTTGKEIVLASRDLAVKTALSDMYPNIRTVRATTTGRSFSPGHKAGQRANIHDRPNVGAGGARALPR